MPRRDDEAMSGPSRLFDVHDSHKSLEVRKSNSPAINFYLGFDFKIVGDRKNYYSNPIEDAYVMEHEVSD